MKRMRPTWCQIKRLSERANVLPVLAQTDTLTMNELAQVREAVRVDLAKAMPETGGFGLFGATYDEDGQKVCSHFASLSP